jgi:hypothetical protein
MTDCTGLEYLRKVDPINRMIPLSGIPLSGLHCSAKNCSNVTGNISAIAGGGVALTAATGGAALGLFIAAGVVGILAAGATCRINKRSHEKHEKHTTKLRDALREDMDNYEKFQRELSALTNEGFEFELGHKNEIRKYEGNGKEQFRRLTEYVIPSLEVAKLTKIKENSTKLIFGKLISAVIQMLKDEKEPQNNIKKGEIVGASAQPIAGIIKFFAKEGVEEAAEVVVKGVTEVAAKEATEVVVKEAAVAGGKIAGGVIGIGLGGIFLVMDVYQLCKDGTKKSIGESFFEMADDISRLPPAEIDF